MGPRIGCTIVKKIMSSEELTADWHNDLQVMSSRIKSMREALYNELVRLKTPGTWEHIVEQVRQALI
jgi:aspartate aminotransferase